LGSSHRTDDAKFVISVSCREAGSSGPYLTFKSSPFDAGAEMKFFCDDYIFAGEPGIDGVYNIYNKAFSDPEQAAVQFDTPDADMMHYTVNLTTPNTECLNTSMHEHSTWPPNAYSSMAGLYYDFFFPSPSSLARTYGIQTSLMWSYTQFDGGFDWWDDEGFKNRLCGLRRGGTWFASYGGKALASGILDGGEYAMDLSQNSGSYTWKMFETGRVEITNVCSTGGGINLGGCSAICATGWAIMGTGPWAVAFGVASGVAALIEAVDTDTGIDYRAEGTVYVRYIVDTFPSYHTESEATGASVTWPTNGSYSISKPVVENNINWVAGDCYTLIVDLESASCARTDGWGTYKATNQTVFKCTGNEGITAANDFNNWTLMVRRP